VTCEVDTGDNDVVRIYRTGGSNNPNGQLIAVLDNRGSSCVVAQGQFISLATGVALPGALVPTKST
jgi:hypothetical protein